MIANVSGVHTGTCAVGLIDKILIFIPLEDNKAPDIKQGSLLGIIFFILRVYCIAANMMGSLDRLRKFQS